MSDIGLMCAAAEYTQMSADVDEAQHARMHNPEQLEFGKHQRRLCNEHLC